MKSSFYNLFVKADNNEYILYNTLSGAAFIVDEQVKTLFEKKDKLRADDFDKNDFKSFKNEGVIIDDSVDEKKIVKVKNGQNKFQSRYFKFVVIPTYQCNLVCPYCYVERDEITGKKMSNETLNATIKFIKKTVKNNDGKELSLTLFGGEPLMNQNSCYKLLEALILWCKKEKILFHPRIYTNGTLITKDVIEKFKKYSMSFIQITLAGTKNIHDSKRTHKDKTGSYEETIKAVKLTFENNLPLVVAINVDNDNFSHMDELLDDLVKRGLKGVRIMFTPIYSMPHSCAGYSPHCLTINEWGEILPELQKMAINKGFNVPIKPYIEPFFCWASVKNSYVVDPYGDLYKCTSLLEKKYKIGSIDKNGDIKFLEFPYYDIMSRDPLSIKACNDCKLLPICGGGCAALACFEHKTFHRENCTRVRPGFEKKIKIIFEKELLKK